MIRLPLLLDSNLQPVRALQPIEYGLTDNLTPLSMASLTLPCKDSVAPRDYVALFAEKGSAGIFRASNVRTDPGGTSEITLQHGLCTLSDHMHPGQSTNTGSCRQLMTELLSNQVMWILGDVDVPDDQDLTWECSNTNDLEGLLAIMKELPGYYLDTDQSVTPWVLHVRERSTEIDCEARIDRNVDKVQIDYDPSNMCTRAYTDGLDAPIDADTIDFYGEIARHVSADEDLGSKVITQTVERYLEQNKHPRVTITLTARELAKLTGEPFDRFRKGMLCRCILPDMTVVQRIESIERPDVIGQPELAILTLASTLNDMSATVAGLVVDTRHVNQLVQQLEKNLRIEAETIDMIAQEIALMATKVEVDGLSSRISQAEVSLNETIGQLALRVTYNDFNTAINEVSLELDAVNSTLTAKADLTLLDGYLRVSDSAAIAQALSAQDIFCSSVSASSTMWTEQLSAGSVYASWLSVNGVDVGAKLNNLDARLSTLGV